MKKYIAIIILLFVGISGVNAQTFSDDNFVYTAAPKKKVQSASFNTLTKNDMSQSVTYFDGLGRPVQTTAINQGDTDGAVTNIDIITPIEYDSFGRQVKEYLPYYSTNTTTSYARIANTASIVAQNGVYNTAKYGNTIYPFSEKRFESSPLNRVLEQAAPGNDWALANPKKNTIKLEYQTNITSDAVRLFKATTNWNIGTLLYDITFSDAGSYAEYELYKTVTFDENSGVSPTETSGSTVEFKNKNGQVILKRTYDATTKHDTYYVYDIYGNLTYVIPPLASGAISTNVLNGLCYQYKYDDRNRLAAKKLPGKQWEFIVYDKLDRPVATGPAFSPWGDGTIGMLITEYDVFGRITQTGWKVLSVSESTRGTWQGNINGGTNPFALVTNDILTKNYYDNYSFTGAQTPPPTIELQTVLTNVKTLPTGSWIRTLTIPTATLGETNTIFYDEYARPIQNYSLNYLGGFTITSTNLDFTGKTIYTVTKHKRTSANVDITIREDFKYTPQDLLKTHTHKIATLAAAELMAGNKYDNLGQLMSKTVGGTDVTGAVGLQKIDYNYNIRGWLTEINKIANLQQGSDPRDLFAFKINYNKVEGNAGFAKALYNGNIAETYWSSGLDGPNISRGYGYQYDQLNRLKNASYQAPLLADNQNYFGESMDYDMNGNIIKLQRKYMAGTSAAPYVGDLDNLGYFYKTDSNQLMKVTDATNIPGGFKDDSNGTNDTADDYNYDLNGNLIKDDNKGITAISYNYLNLPRKITFGTIGSIEYIYNAAGQKLQKIVIETGKATVTTDYLGGFQYKGIVLEFFPTAEGYVKNASGNLSYVFQYKDHLGNVRANYTKNSSNVLEIIDENNYYPFGLNHVSFMNIPQSNNKYKYNGKELQDENIGGNQLNLYDYGFRNFDPAIGRWMNVDPYAEVADDETPYQYVHNNPVIYIDPKGLVGEISDNNGFATKYTDRKGNVLLDTNDGSDDVIVVPDAQLKDFKDLIDVTPSSMSDRVDWNENMKAKFLGFKTVGEMNYLLGGFTRQWSRQNAINYIQNPTYANALAMSFSEALSQWSDPQQLLAMASMLASIPNPEGIVYLRTDRTLGLKPYAGQVKNEVRYLARQAEHARDFPNADFEFKIIDRGSAAGSFPTSLDVKEQQALNKLGGPTNKSNPNGGASNKKNVIRQ